MSGIHRAVMASLMIAAAGCAGGAPPLSDADRTALADVRETYRQAVLAGDAAAAASVYAADAVEMPPNMPLVQGRDAIQARYEAQPALSTFQVTSAEAVGFGDLAYDRGSFTLTMTPPGMPMAVADTGKYLVIARKQADGSWLISRATWNSDRPLPAAAPPDTAGAM